MDCPRFLALSLLLCCTLGVCLAGGKKDYQEECSILGHVSNVFTSDKNDDPNACNTDKGLICGTSSKCVCNPGLVYEKGLLGLSFLGGTCVGAANRPCLGGADSKARCVANAHCGDSAVSLCMCNDGYKANSDGYCTNGANFLKTSAATSAMCALTVILAVFFAQG